MEQNNSAQLRLPHRTRSPLRAPTSTLVPAVLPNHTKEFEKLTQLVRVLGDYAGEIPPPFSGR